MKAYQVKWNLSNLVAALSALALMFGASEAFAFQGNTPYAPGVSVGVPAGALPPPGFYGDLDTFWVNGGVKNNSGKSVPVNVSEIVSTPALIYVPNFQFLGATYAAVLAQPWIFQAVDAKGVPGGTTRFSNGLFNTIIEPIALSWNLKNGFFVKTGLAFYLPDGYTSHLPSGAIAPTAIANDFLTMEPDFAVSYLNNGWNFTAHAVFDFNLEDTTAHFQDGTVFYLDLTAGKTFGKWTFGLGGNYTQQLTKDKLSGVSLADSQIQHILLGPYVSYDFGPVTLTSKLLAGLRAENTANATFFHVDITAPF